MRYLTYIFLCLCLFTGPLSAKPSPAIQNALNASWQVVLQETSGSGVAVAHINKGTLVMTNDHICQASRGLNPLSREPKFNSKLNSTPISIRNLKQKFQARVVRTSNLHLLRPPQKGSDLCLLYVEAILPLAGFASNEFEPGDELITIGAPSGFFPSIHKGYAGAMISSPRSPILPTLFVTAYANYGSSGGGVFNEEGKLGGIVFAIAQDDQNNSPVVTHVIPLEQVLNFIEDYKGSLSKEGVIKNAN